MNQSKSSRVITLCLLLVFCACPFAGADSIKLKNGSVMNGTIVSEAADGVVMRMSGGEVSFSQSEIDQIIREGVKEEKKEVKHSNETQLENITGPEKDEIREIFNQKDGDAAPYYLEAIKQMKYPESKEVSEKMSNWLAKGWQGENEELKDILKLNQPTFDQLETAVLLKDCFLDISSQSSLELLIKFRRMGILVCLRGRYMESQGDYSKAIENYRINFEIAGHLSKNWAVLALIGLAIEGRTYANLKEYLDRPNISTEELKKVFYFLEFVHKNHFDLRDLMVASKKEFKGILSTVKIKGVHSDKVADYYYGSFIRAASTGRSEDWDIAWKRIEKLTSIAEKRTSMIKNLFGKNDYRRGLWLSLSVALSSVKNVIGAYRDKMKILQELREAFRVRVAST